jgi:hypothetical protein
MDHRFVPPPPKETKQFIAWQKEKAEELLAAVEGVIQLLDGRTEPLHPLSWQVELQRLKESFCGLKEL